MFFKNTLDLLKKIQNLDIPVSNTTRGEAIQQTYRNNLTAKIRNTFFEDCKAYFESEAEDGMSIIPFITKEGIILDIPNSYIADKTDPNYCNGSVSLEIGFTLKGLEFDGSEAEREFKWQQEQSKKKAEEAEAKKQAQIEKTRLAREERERKRAKALEAAMAEIDD